MVTIQQGLREDGIRVSMAKLCRWFGQPRRTVYYQATKAAPKLREALAAPIKALIDQEPSFGYRTVAGLLGMNKNTVQRIFQLKGWQVRKRAVGFRPRIEALPSVAQAPDERWATDLCRVWGGRDGWLTLALVIDCYTRQLLGWHLSRSGKATTAAAALEQALITRFGVLGRVSTPFLLRSDNGLVFQPPLHPAGAQLRLAAGVHYPALPAAERHGRAGHPHAEGAVSAPAPLRKPTARDPGDWRLDPVLQPPPPAPGTGHEDTRRGVRFSGLTCAGTAGSLHMPITASAPRYRGRRTAVSRSASCAGHRVFAGSGERGYVQRRHDDDAQSLLRSLQRRGGAPRPTCRARIDSYAYRSSLGDGLSFEWYGSAGAGQS